MPELRIVLTIVALLGAMIISGAIGIRHRSGAISLALLSFVWLTLDSRFEGRVLLDVTKTNGLTSADLVGVAGFLVSLGMFRWRRKDVTPCAHGAQCVHCAGRAPGQLGSASSDGSSIAGK